MNDISFKFIDEEFPEYTTKVNVDDYVKWSQFIKDRSIILLLMRLIYIVITIQENKD